MKQIDFNNLKVGDKVLTIYKGQVSSMYVKNIYSKERQKKCVVLKNPNGGNDILRHMYAIYINDIPRA